MTSPRHRSVSHARDLWADALGRATIRALQGLVLLTATVVVVYGLIQLKLVVIPLLIALILAAALHPVVGFLRRRGVPGALATWITFLAAIVVLGGVVTGIVFAVRSEWDELVLSAVGGLERLRQFIVAGPIPIGQKALDEAITAVVDFTSSPQFGAGALLGIFAATQVITGAVLVAVILYFFLQDGAKIWAFFLCRFHGENLEKLLTSGTTTLHVLGGYVRGTALVALVANGPVVALVVVAVVVAINQLDGRVLQPMVLGRALSLHPLVVLLALAGGAILSGVVGAVLAVPLTAVGWALIQIWFPASRAPDALSGKNARPGAVLPDPPGPEAPTTT